MAVSTIKLRAGDEFSGKDLAKYKTIRVVKCGLHREGSGPAVGTVTLEIDDGEKESPAKKESPKKETPAKKESPAK